MLGFDAYTKSIIGTIIKQRISLFLVKRNVINYPIFLKQSGNKPAENSIIDMLYDVFVTELGYYGDPSVYEEYAFASILIEEPDYDFLSNDAATSIRKAREALKKQFAKAAQTLFKVGDKNSGLPSSTVTQLDNVFGFLTQAKFQREIPKYAENYNAYYGTGPTGIVSQYRSFKSAFLVPTDKKGINTIKSPFYVEYFYRLKTSSPPLTGTQREYYNYFSNKDNIIATTNPPSAKAGPEGSPQVDDPGDPLLNFDKNFDRGIRLMFNLSAGLGQDQLDATPQNWSHWPFVPTDNLPFFKGDKKTYTDLFPLPFLSAYTKGEEAPDLLKRGSDSFASILFNVLSIISTRPTAKKGYFQGKYNNKLLSGDFKLNFYALLASNYWNSIYPKGDKPKVPTADSGPKFWPPALQWSKSLVSLEIKEENPEIGKDPCYAYFPMIVGEFVDTTGMMKDQDPQLLEELLKTDTITYLSSLVPATISASPLAETIKKQLQLNKINLTRLSNFGPDSTNPFNTKEEEKGLDNMLINLINFDEE